MWRGVHLKSDVKASSCWWRPIEQLWSGTFLGIHWTIIGFWHWLVCRLLGRPVGIVCDTRQSMSYGPDTGCLLAEHCFIAWPDQIYPDKIYPDKTYLDNIYRTKYMRTKYTGQNLAGQTILGQNIPDIIYRAKCTRTKYIGQYIYISIWQYIYRTKYNGQNIPDKKCQTKYTLSIRPIISSYARNCYLLLWAVRGRKKK